MSRSLLFSVLLMFLPGLAPADDSRTYTVPEILALSSAPSGIVFEIVTNDPDSLQDALPEVRRYVAALHERFPSLQMAVVSHGLELFLLQTHFREEYPATHDNARALAGNTVALHVCGNYAGAHGAMPEGFPAFVDVVEDGPLRIEAYKQEGYLHVEVRTLKMFCPLQSI